MKDITYGITPTNDPRGSIVRKRCEIHDIQFYFYGDENDKTCPICAQELEKSGGG